MLRFLPVVQKMWTFGYLETLKCPQVWMNGVCVCLWLSTDPSRVYSCSSPVDCWGVIQNTLLTRSGTSWVDYMQALKGQRGKCSLERRGEARRKLVGGSCCDNNHMQPAAFDACWLTLWTPCGVFYGEFDFAPSFVKICLELEMQILSWDQNILNPDLKWNSTKGDEFLNTYRRETGLNVRWEASSGVQEHEDRNSKIASTDSELQVTGTFDSAPAWQEAKKGVEATAWVFIWMLLTASFVTEQWRGSSRSLGNQMNCLQRCTEFNTTDFHTCQNTSLFPDPKVWGGKRHLEINLANVRNISAPHDTVTVMLYTVGEDTAQRIDIKGRLPHCL